MILSATVGLGYPFDEILFHAFWRLSLGDATPKAKDVTKPFATDGLFRLPGGVLTICYATLGFSLSTPQRATQRALRRNWRKYIVPIHVA